MGQLAPSYQGLQSITPLLLTDPAGPSHLRLQAVENETTPYS